MRDMINVVKYAAIYIYLVKLIILGNNEETENTFSWC